MTFCLAIVGRPNVGKSTLFNRLTGRKAALVHDQPGMTRDRRQEPARLGPYEFDIIDTAGLDEPAAMSGLEAEVQRQTEQAIAEADGIALMIDARSGITPLDAHFAGRLRRTNRPVILIANKCEGSAADAGVLECHGLGLGEPVAMSAEHGLGLADLADALAPLIERGAAADAAGADGEHAIRLAIVGRPNVGKSTLVNALLGEQRVVTSDVPGTTRDAVTVPYRHGDRPILLVDTAGLRRRTRVTSRPEQLSVQDTLRFIRRAHVVILVLDAAAMLDRQDLAIANLAIEEGRALVLALNKWDLIDDRTAALQRLRDRMERSLPQLRGLAAVPLSALRGWRLDRLMAAVGNAHEVWARRIPTGPLNRWLEQALASHPPPLVGGRRLKIRYATQTSSSPPAFALWVNRPADLPDTYRKYLLNGLREAFELPGTPIRLNLRKGHNPYGPS